MKRKIFSHLLCLLAALITPFQPLAHESPVDHVDRAIRIWFEKGKLFVRYQIQLSERSATMQLAQMDTNRDGEISDAERTAFFATQQKVVCALLELKLDGKKLELAPEGSVELLPQLRQNFIFSAKSNAEQGKHAGEFLDLYSRNYPGAYRWDEPKRPQAGATPVQVSEAPKIHATDGHPSVLLIKFQLQIP